jgi:uncharacterized membrane protein
MARLHARLHDWQDQGLLSPAQAQAIQTYEENKPSAARFLWRYGLLGLGILAIGLGLIAMVASNWAAIPAWVKLGGHIIVNGIVAAVLFAWYRRGEKTTWRFEALLIVKAVLVLTLIALIGQIVQTQSSLENALRLWWFLVTPMLLVFGHTRNSMVLWTGLTVYVLFNWLEYIHPVQFLPSVIALMMPILYVFLAHVPWWRQNKKSWAESGSHAVLFFTMLLLQGLFFEKIGKHDPVFLQALLASALLYIVLLFLRRHYLNIVPHITDIFMLFQALIVFLVPYVPSLPLFMLYWLVVGLIGVYRDHRGIVAVAVMALALRIVAFYFELYQSLMMTGTILMIAGLGVIWLVKTYPTWRAALMRLLPARPA